MSIPQQAPSALVTMTETSAIKHYKKQLIYRQHDLADAPVLHHYHHPAHAQFLNEVGNTKIYDLAEERNNNNNNNGKAKIEKKIRRKRKNKNCRGQFRHEAMELIKLGGNSSHTLCKSKEHLSKPPPTSEPPPPKDDRHVPQTPSSTASVIQTHVNKTILEHPLPKHPLPKHPRPIRPPIYTHALPQMVPERRNSRELHPKMPTPYQSPPHRAPLPDYQHRVPFYPHPIAFRPSVTLPPPPPYAVNRSPPRPVPREPIRPIPQQATPYHRNGGYTGIHFPFVRGAELGMEGRKKRRVEEKEENVVAAIDLTVDPGGVRGKKHECQCECGKLYRKEQEVIITVKDGRDKEQVPSTYIRGKMVNGVLQFENNDDKNKNMHNGTNGQNGMCGHNGVSKANAPPVVKGPPAPHEGKLPQLFLIDDLLGKKKLSEPSRKDAPIRPEPNRVIVSRKIPEETRPKSKDHSVSTIMGDNRRQSVDIDTISISSSGSESVKSPRPRSNGIDKQIPHGKLFYVKNHNRFIRYFDDSQKKMFIDSLTSEVGFDKNASEDREYIDLPRNTIFSSKDNLAVEEYVSEMTLVEKFIPRDFFLFYKFVTGYQICNNHLPVSFLTFLKVYNTNGLKVLLERYINSLKQN